MNSRESLLHWSFPCGVWFDTQVRVSVFFPLVFLVVCYRFGLAVGGAFGVILFVSILLHEFAHIVGARSTGGSGDEILLWPLGGLAFCRPASTLGSQVVTAAAGPLLNLSLCLITLPAIVRSPHFREALHPFVMPSVALADQLLLDLLVLTFFANWISLLVNLLPVYPLDGGRILQACLNWKLGGEISTTVYLRTGMVVAVIGVIAGLMFESLMLVAIGAVVLVLNMQEQQQVRAAEAYDESFLGYDFSQGYTSLERSEEPPRRPPRQGFWHRWRERRRLERLRRERERDQAAEQQLDALLEKINTQGMAALTDAEKRLLNRASARYRDKGRQQAE